jgi:2-keto-4-pentenoate hydratase/2-oxohepta-3-ene-1,7-dioic acid hydratase in catechol pathway
VATVAAASRVPLPLVRIARFSAPDQTPRYGVIQGEPGAQDAVITELAGFPLPPFDLSATSHQLSGVKPLAPVVGGKIVAVGRNYADHVREMGGNEPAADPVLFLKPSTSVIGPGDAIALPALSRQVHHEAELAVVIGGIVRRVPVQRALDAVLGYTCANDVTARDLQATDGQWTRAKGFDTFCPLGPWIETELDPSRLAVQCRVDGELRQSGNTADLLRGVAELIAFASAVMTLLPGDVLLTGTPAGVGPIKAGNQVDVTIEGIGTLSNTVVGDAMVAA